MENDYGNGQSRLDKRLDDLEYREERLSNWLRRGIYMILVLFLVIVAVIIGMYVLRNREAPQTYNDLQLRIWREAVAKEPNNPSFHANLGYIYFRMGSNNQASYELDKAAAIDKKHVTAHYYRGLLEKKQGDEDKAIKDFQVAVDNATSGNRFLPAYDLGRIYEGRKDYKKALESYQKAVDDNAVIWNSHYALARIYEKLGDNKKALDEYTSASKFNPENTALKRAIDRLQAK